MESFAERLRQEIDYLGLTRKELSSRADIKQRALDMYLGTQASMPPADVAVRLARALNVTVEYLVTGEIKRQPLQRHPFGQLEADFALLPADVARSIEAMVHVLARRELK